MSVYVMGHHSFVVLSWPELSMSDVSMTSSGIKCSEQSGSCGLVHRQLRALQLSGCVTMRL